MNIIKLSALTVGGLLALTGCPDEVPDSDSDTTTVCETFDTGPECNTAACDYPSADGSCDTLVVNVGDPTCAGDQWGFSVTGQGDPAAAALTWTEEASSTTPWDESGHFFTGSTDTFTLALDVVATPGEVVEAADGSGKTLFKCDNNDGATMTYKIDLYDSGNTATDCVIWGQDAVAIYGSSCFHCTDCAG